MKPPSAVARRWSSRVKVIQLANAIRMLERAEIIDHNGHCSARRDSQSFSINSGASARGTLTIGEPYVFSDAERRACREKLWSPQLFKKIWDHYHSKLKCG